MCKAPPARRQGSDGWPGFGLDGGNELIGDFRVKVAAWLLGGHDDLRPRHGVAGGKAPS
jgi:hypothetical protein